MTSRQSTRILVFVTGLAVGVLAVSLAVGAGISGASRLSRRALSAHFTTCGRVRLSDGGYALSQRGSTCRRARNVLRHFDDQIATGTRHLVPGGKNLLDSQLPFAVYDWRCGGLQGHILCVRGHWHSVNPPAGHPVLDAIFRG